MIDFDWNIDDFINDIESQLEMVETECWEEMKKTGERIRAKSVAEVPKDTHALKESSFISIDEGEREVLVGYAGPFAGVNPRTGTPVEDYALIVHEDLHMPHRRGGKAKFLEDPASAEMSSYEGRVGD